MNSIDKIIPWNQKFLPLAAALAMFGTRVVSGADYPTTILMDNPVAYYRIEEAGGSGTVADSSGNSLIGYVDYATQSDGITVYPQLGLPGIDTNSALFATSTGIGQGDIDVPFDSTFNPTTNGTNGAPFSAEFWAQATKQPANYEVPLDNSSDFSQPIPWNNSAGWNFYQTPGPASFWSFSIRPTPGFVNSGPAVTLGEWTHLVLTYDGTNAVFYVNGSAFGTFPVAQYLANNGSADMLVGQGPNTGQFPFDGYVDEVAIYNYALSSAQVATHYTVGTNSIRALPTPPVFNLQPASTNAYAGVPLTFTAQAGGTAPISYQWTRVGTGPLSNETNNTYTITPSYPADNGAQFYVTATNSAGGTNSTTATLTVLTNLNIVYNPFSITRRAGGYATFRVVANGAVPITYQWHSISNAVDRTLAGATNDTLWFSNVQPSDSGKLFYAHVAGPFGNTDSGQASLTVVARTNVAPVTAYSKVVMADKPVAFWRLDETNGSLVALDAAGSFDGIYSYGGSDLTYGYPSGISHESDTAIHVTNSATVTIPYALELNPVSGPWSYEFWIQPTSLDPNNFHTPISSEGNQNSGANLTGWNIYQHVAGVWTWNIYNGGSGGSFTSEFTDNPIVPGTWYYMVLTDDGTNLNWYSNDRLVLSLTVNGVNFVQNGINGNPAVAGGPTTLAIRSDGVFGAWDGGIDEVAVYNYVLNPQQMQNHFLNTTHLTAVKSGNNIVITWPAGTLQAAPVVNGSYTNVVGATSPYTNAISGSQQYYRAQLQ